MLTELLKTHAGITDAVALWARAEISDLGAVPLRAAAEGRREGARAQAAAWFQVVAQSTSTGMAGSSGGSSAAAGGLARHILCRRTCRDYLAVDRGGQIDATFGGGYCQRFWLSRRQVLA
jgi:hypothetical protein